MDWDQNVVMTTWRHLLAFMKEGFNVPLRADDTEKQLNSDINLISSSEFYTQINRTVDER